MLLLLYVISTGSFAECMGSVGGPLILSWLLGGRAAVVFAHTGGRALCRQHLAKIASEAQVQNAK